MQRLPIRYDRNPLRLLDCKILNAKNLAWCSSLEECLCDECKAHFEGLKELLTLLALITWLTITGCGLDYYTKLLLKSIQPLGAQSAVCGGGRYDGLIEEVGGPATPGIGFAMGMERVLLALKAKTCYRRQIIPWMYSWFAPNKKTLP